MSLKEDALEPRLRIKLVNRVFQQLDRDASGDVTRSDLYSYTKSSSKQFASFARTLWGELDADGDGRLTLSELSRALDVDLLLLGNPSLYDAFRAIDVQLLGRLAREDIDAFIEHERLPADLRDGVKEVFSRLTMSPNGVITAVQLTNVTPEDLELLKKAGAAVRRTGYVPPEESETTYDDSWDRRVILESRRNSGGGMSVKQADILNTAIGID